MVCFAPLCTRKHCTVNYENKNFLLMFDDKILLSKKVIIIFKHVFAYCGKSYSWQAGVLKCPKRLPSVIIYVFESLFILFGQISAAPALALMINAWWARLLSPPWQLLGCAQWSKTTHFVRKYFFEFFTN